MLSSAVRLLLKYLLTALFQEKCYGIQNVCFDFFTSFAWNISHFKNNSVRYYHKCKQIFKWSTCYSGQISWIFLQIFENYLNIKFHENPSSERASLSMQTDREPERPKDRQRQTDIHDEANVTFRNFMNFLTAMQISERVSSLYWTFTQIGDICVWNDGSHFFIFILLLFFFSMSLWPNAGHGLLSLQVSRLHTTTHHSR
jgi:hypothetical protein